MTTPINIIWFRRDLRLTDNAALYHALRDNNPVLPIFIFDKNILNELEDKTDARVQFIFNTFHELQNRLVALESSLEVYYDNPLQAFKNLLHKYNIEKVFTNHDYEPYAVSRDYQIEQLLNSNGISFHTYKDQVIFEKAEVVKDDGTPYTVFTPYSRKWKSNLAAAYKYLQH
jgi:deoxyribodipyrimidine photo-lyase